jgi:methionine synthase II (cobalamin-independent)
MDNPQQSSHAAGANGAMLSAPASLPILPTSVVGSYSWPGWVWSGLEAYNRGEFGPADWNEMLDDAVDTAIRDQEDAGVDIIYDGEMRRVGFFTAEFYSHLTGLRPIEPERRRVSAVTTSSTDWKALT